MFNGCLPTGNAKNKASHMKASEILSMNDFELAIYTLLQKSPDRIKHCVRNAMIGINKAWGIKDIDPEMAAFRAITAEEEAATAIIESLKIRKYDGAKRLKARDHRHKSAIWFIISCAKNAFSVLDGRIDVKCTVTGGFAAPQIKFQFVGQPFDGWFFPEPPLNFFISMSNEKNSEIQFIEKEIKEYIEMKGKKDFRSYVQSEANLRNQILYSSPAGIAKIESGLVELIESRRSRVIQLLVVCAFICCYSERQTFVQYVLTILLERIFSKND